MGGGGRVVSQERLPKLKTLGLILTRIQFLCAENPREPPALHNVFRDSPSPTEGRRILGVIFGFRLDENDTGIDLKCIQMAQKYRGRTVAGLPLPEGEITEAPKSI